MDTLYGILFLFLSFIGIIGIMFFIFIMKGKMLESLIREKLILEFKKETSDAMKIIENERITQEKILFEKESKLDELINEAGSMSEKNIQSGIIQGKQEILQTMASIINSYYSSKQTKTKLQAFVNHVREQSKL